MKQGTIEAKEQKPVNTGKLSKYTIDGVVYSTFDFHGFEEGDIVEYDWEDNNGYKNLTEINLIHMPGQEETVEATDRVNGQHADSKPLSQPKHNLTYQELKDERIHLHGCINSAIEVVKCDNRFLGENNPDLVLGTIKEIAADLSAWIKENSRKCCK